MFANVAIHNPKRLCPNTYHHYLYHISNPIDIDPWDNYLKRLGRTMPLHLAVLFGQNLAYECNLITM